VTRVLALVAAPSLESPAGTEFLRVLVGLRGAGAEVVLVEAGAGRGALSGAEPALDLDGERWLAALVEDGVAPRGTSDLAAEVAAADAVVLFPDPGRSGRPGVLGLPRHERPSEALLSEVFEAGQLVLGSAFRAP